MAFDVSFLISRLLERTSFFNLKLWIVILICIALFISFLFLFSSLCFLSLRRRWKFNDQLHYRTSKKNKAPILPKICHRNNIASSSMDKRLLSRDNSGIELGVGTPPNSTGDLNLEAIGRSRRRPVEDVIPANQFTHRELAIATNGFADENVIGSGDFGVVYRGVLLDQTQVAVKKLLYHGGKIEEFIVEAEAIRCIRHRNLIKLLGYCTEGAYRMLVFEYLDSDNLHQWLHKCVGQVSPLTWNTRMKIILGVAKGLAYLHEDIEPAIVHQHLTSNNILLDHHWNPKISDFGIAKILVPKLTHAITPLVRVSAYVAPEYAATGPVSVTSDVFSFGVLVMEVVSGKTPKDHHNGAPTEAGLLVDWFKAMVAEKKLECVVDPKLPETPPSKELKRILLIALRCVDHDVNGRPKMGEVIHMLEPFDLLLSDARRVADSQNM